MLLKQMLYKTNTWDGAHYFTILCCSVIFFLAVVFLIALIFLCVCFREWNTTTNDCRTALFRI